MNGYKTYAIAGLGVGHAAIGWYLGLHGSDTALELAIAASGLGTLRHGVTSEARRVLGASVASGEEQDRG